MGNRSVAPMRAAKIGYIVISACLCVFGCLLMSMPTFSAALLGVICGVLLIVFGAVRLVGYFSRDLFRLAFQYDLTLGIVLIVMGVILLLHPAGLMTFLCVALGLYIFADGLFKLQIALESRRFGIGVRGITLELLGGYTEMDRDAPSPRVDALVALVRLRPPDAGRGRRAPRRRRRTARQQCGRR